MKKYIMLLLALVMFAGCGAGGGATPPGSTALFNPTSISVEGLAASPVSSFKGFFTLNVKDPNGNDLESAKIHFIFQFTKLPAAGVATESLVTWDGTNSSLFEFVDNTNASGNIVLQLSIQGNGGLSYQGNLYAYDDLGKLLATAVVTVTSK